MKLKQQAFRGGIATFGAQGVKFVLQLVLIGVLARLVAPEDFGLIGMLASGIALLELFRDLGLAAVIVQRPTLGESELNALFRVSIGIGVVMLGLVIGAGWGLAHFVSDPRLISIAPAYGLMFVMNSLGSVPLGLLRRRMQFKRIAIREVIAFCMGVGAAITVALHGGGYWALVTMPLVNSFVNMTAAWVAARWIPGAEVIPFSETLKLLKFGGVFTLSEVANYLCQNLDNILIGKVWGLGTLGFYTRAYALMLAPINQVMGPIGTVLVPVLSRLNSHPDRYRFWIRRLFGLFLMGSGPIAAVLMAGSGQVVHLLLGDGWELTAEIFFWLGISLYGKPAASLLYWVFISSGDAGGLLRWTTVNAVLTVIAIVCGVFWGPVAVAAAYSVTGCLIRTPVAIWYGSKTGRVSFGDLLKVYLGSLAVFLVWLGALSGTVRILTDHGVADPVVVGVLAVLFCSAALSYFALTNRGRTLVGELRTLIRPGENAAAPC